MRNPFAILLMSLGVISCGEESINSVQIADQCPQAATNGAPVGGPFELVNHLGDTATEADFLGRPTLVYFGFTYCPDVCPLSLQQMAAALNLLPDEQRAQFQPVLISIDPERDTPDAMATYVNSNAFPENLVGLTGSLGSIRAAADSYKVYFEKIEDPDSAAEYTMDHSSIIFLMDANGDFVDLFTHTTTPDEMADVMSRHLECAGE